MFRNYIKIAWRSIQKNRFHSLVNIIGLSTGIAFVLLIGAFGWSELQVNHDLKNAKNQYIIQSNWKSSNFGPGITTVAALAKTLKQEYPNLVANYYRWDGISSNVSKGDRHFREALQVGDSTLLSMYGFSLADGDPATALQNPYSVVISNERAIKYFGKTQVAGQTLTVESFSGSKHDFKITGVLNKLSRNSVTGMVDAGLFFPESDTAFFGRGMEGWRNIYIVSFLELQKGVTPKDLEKPMQALILKNAPPEVAQNLLPSLVSLEDYYLDGNGGVVRKMLYSLSFVVIFILVMAVINFINISIGKSTSRMKEIGIRKVLGGLRAHLILQFLLESMILVFLSTILSVIIYELAKNYFGNVLGRQLPDISNFPVYFLAIPVLLSVVIGLLAGIYPAFVLSSFKSADSLKGKLNSVKENILLRKALVAFQFCTACIACIGAFIITHQVTYFFGKDLGYDKDYVISAQVPRNWSLNGVARMENLRTEFASLPEVRNASLSYEIPNGNNQGSTSLWKMGADSTKAVSARMLTTDKDYASTYGIPMAAGNFFNETNDSLKIVINETAAKTFGWNHPEKAINQQMRITGLNLPLIISGVTKDFHFTTMQGQIDPILFLNVNLGLRFRYLSFKIRPGNAGTAIATLQKKWEQAFPGAAFEYAYMDDNLKKMYQAELQLKQASYIATILSLVIIILGVLGLISLSIQNRTKEIGIRKILGSPISGIIGLFLKDFLSVIIVAGIIACPLAYFIMNRWLEGYAYRVQVTALPFVLSILLLGLITVLVIVMQTIKAALANPVKSLRTE